MGEQEAHDDLRWRGPNLLLWACGGSQCLTNVFVTFYRLIILNKTSSSHPEIPVSVY